MVKVEYKIMSILKWFLEEELNRLGQQGWRYAGPASKNSSLMERVVEEKDE